MATFRKRSGKWQVRIQRTGLPDVSKTFLLKSDAEAWARTLESEMDRGVFVDRSEAERTTLADILRRYREEVTANKRSGSIESIRINKLLKDESICRYKATALTGKLFAQWRDKRLKEVSGSTVNRELNIVSHAINVARKEWGIHISNPIELIQRPRNNKARERTLSDQEKVALFKELGATPRKQDGTFAKGGTHNPYLLPVVRLALETGMRQSELVSLQWEHINLSIRTAFLPMTKNGLSRSVPLSPTALSILRAMYRERGVGFVFEGLTTEAVKRGFSRACKRAGLVDLHFHDLRHSATTHLFQLGLNVMEVASITGHRDLRMLQRYTHLKAEDIALKLAQKL